MPQEISVELKREGPGHWQYAWRPEKGQTFYPINRERIRHPVNEHARELFNAAISGLIVRVQASYDKQMKILKVFP